MDVQQQSSGTRIYYLDAVRAFCMFAGIFTHGTSIAFPVMYEIAPFALVQFVNDLFRNATFFFVSGFFTTLVWEKNSLSSYVRNRVDSLLVPLVASLILIAPVTNWMIHVWHNGPMGFLDYLTGGWRRPTVGNDTWALHFWFLFSLLIYAALTPAIAALVRSPMFDRAMDWYLARTKGFTQWTNVLLFALAVVVGRALYDQGFRHLAEGTPFAWIARASLNFLPIYALGVISFAHRRFLDTLVRFSPLGLFLFIVLHFVIVDFGEGLPRALERTLYWLIYAGAMLFLINAILWAFQRWLNKPSPALSFAVDAAYPFYLFHFTFIYLVAFAVRPFVSDPVAIWVVIVLVATPLILLWHALVIRRFALTRRLFMGKPPRPTAARPVPAAE
ncbi:MAG: acyltransferase family protein [Sphingomonadaceae bacterium]